MLLSIDSGLFTASSPSVPSADEYLARKAWQVYCRAARNFTDRQRIAYVLCELEGISQQEAVSVGGLHMISIQEAIHQARDYVKEELDHFGRMDDYPSFLAFLRRIEDLLSDPSGLTEQIIDYITEKY